ncbi:MAG: heme ABC exporter ATP-binding protein CcmA [Rhodospirillaceae bacterium]|nr:heme ABC exporter ATP-binding protein CcmA [Rhodospirillaceae bacterium]MBL6930946.1 heme ABC exporter ATP-binding protein CcmA [Rhodospirillales bacterium]MBL6942330.1 heme ABC exporter ATP-binding protein CcmA [Rhodospirillales bacterium]
MSIFCGQNLICVRGERTVFTDLDFNLDAGGALVLIGPNGSGKSSLLRLMSGLLPQAAGSLSWNNEEIREDPEAHADRMHYVGHHDAVKPVLSVAENVAFWASLRGRGKKTQSAVMAALEAFGIAHLAEVPGRFLSAGQKRRVNLARILAAPAPLWLLDEPTTALDKQTIGALEATIAAHRAGGGMVVISTHSDMGLESFKVLDLAGFAIRQAS